MTVTGIVTSASDIAAILDTVAPDKGTPLADTPIWNELRPRWAKMQRQFKEWEAEIAPPEQPDQPVQVVEETPAPVPRPRKSPRGGPKSGPTGSSTRRAANAPQAPTENVSEGTQPGAEPEEASCS